MGIEICGRFGPKKVVVEDPNNTLIKSFILFKTILAFNMYTKRLYV